MAKKKRKKQTLLGLSGMAVCCIGFLLLQEVKELITCEKPETPKLQTEKPEIPELQTGKKEQIIYHEGYTVSYNSDY
ncbi:MAG: hypothetical protein LBQ73_01155, partial [Tannerellaceae bacterium]|nr:hypothetical protein [Tannerellaceae bacterium]